MKHTELKRTTPLKRTPMKKRKRRKGDKPEIRHAYLETHSCCAVCWCGWREFDNWLEVHHIVGGSGRLDARANLLTLCRSCHEHYHSGFCLTPGHLLTAKRESDPEGYDESLILKLLGRQALPERWLPAPIPQWALDARNAR